MKFKVGDEVIVIRNDVLGECRYFQVGDRGLVDFADDNDGTYSVDFGDGITWWASEEELELEFVFNSPLYQALK